MVPIVFNLFCSGFKFNEEENNKVSEAKKLQKWALGLQDSDDEAEAAEKEVEEVCNKTCLTSISILYNWFFHFKIDKRLDAVFSKKPHIKKVVPVGGETQIKGEQKGRIIFLFKIKNVVKMVN